MEIFKSTLVHVTLLELRFHQTPQIEEKGVVSDSTCCKNLLKCQAMVMKLYTKKS